MAFSRAIKTLVAVCVLASLSIMTVTFQELRGDPGGEDSASGRRNLRLGVHEENRRVLMQWPITNFKARFPVFSSLSDPAPEVLIKHAKICNRDVPEGLSRIEYDLRRRKIQGINPHYGVKLDDSPAAKKRKKMLLLDGDMTLQSYGAQMNALLHAYDYVRDKNMTLGIRKGSWAMEAIELMFLADINSYDWEERMETILGAQIIQLDGELDRYFKVVRMSAEDLYYYQTDRQLEKTKQHHKHIIRTLFRNSNRATGVSNSTNVRDVCSSLNSLFGNHKRDVKYSVVHNRYMEGQSLRVLGWLSILSGADPKGAVTMEPDYVKSILKPLGLLDHPIIYVSDGEQPEVLQLLKNDTEIGPKLQVLHPSDKWVGGMITLGVASNAYIGNPASPTAGFIARARYAFGFKDTYMFRAKDKDGNWKSVCQENCMFDYKIMRSLV